jgi:hypothetical protein
MPTAFGADGTRRQLCRVGERRIRSQDSIDHATPTVVPLAAAVSHAGIGKAKTFLRSAPFMGELDEELIDDAAFL